MSQIIKSSDLWSRAEDLSRRIASLSRPSAFTGFGFKVAKSLGEVSTSSTSYVDLGGPSLSIFVPPTGRISIVTSGVIRDAAGAASQRGRIAYELTRPDNVILVSGDPIVQGDEQSPEFQLGVFKNYLIEGLQSGQYGLKLLYSVEFGGGTPMYFSNRILMGIPS